MKDVIVKDDIGNIIKTKKYNYNITVGGKYAHEVFTFKMPDTDVFIYGVVSDPIQYYKINTGPSIPEGVLDISQLPCEIREKMYPEDVDGTYPMANRDSHTVYTAQIVSTYIIR